MTEAYIPEKSSSERKRKNHGHGKRFVYDKILDKVVPIEDSPEQKRKFTCKRSPMLITGNWAKGWYEHIATDPIYIESKAHLARECAKRGLMARALIKPKSQGTGDEMRR